MPMTMTAFMKPMIQRKLPETKVPTIAPVLWSAGMLVAMARVAKIKPIINATTTVECPKENHIPTV